MPNRMAPLDLLAGCQHMRRDETERGKGVEVPACPRSIGLPVASTLEFVGAPPPSSMTNKRRSSTEQRMGDVTSLPLMLGWDSAG